MGFYEEISRYYDYIFPVGDEQVTFIEESAGTAGSKVLDVACGSGGYTAVLAEKGYDVTAVDIDNAMVDTARRKLEGLGLKAGVMQSDMKSLAERIKSSFKCIFCIGNSIVHLGSNEDILKAIKQMQSLLEENGTLILQIINYDRIIKYGVNELPPISNQEAGIEFVRKYEYDREKEIINFKTALKVKESGGNRVFENSIELLPVLSDKMMDLLEQAGFRRIQFYGDFNKSPYSDASYMLVVKADK